MQGKLTTALAAIAVCTGLTLPGAAQAADYTATTMFSWVTSGTTYQLEEGHFVFTGDFSGLALPDPGAEGPLGQIISYVCPGIFNIGAEASGFCVGTDGEGDQVYLTWSTTPLPAEELLPGQLAAGDGVISYYGGTGKFEGITGGGTFRGNTMSVLPNGNFAGFSPLTLSYTIPD